MGQMFYSMSLAMGIMVTYGSYTKNETSLTKSVNQIEIFDYSRCSAGRIYGRSGSLCIQR